MNLDDVRAGLCAVPAFAKLPSAMVERVGMALLRVGAVRSLEIGETLFVEGDDRGDMGCVLLKGEVEVFREKAEPTRCPAPDLLGEMQQLAPTAQRTATVQATQPATVLEFRWHDFVIAASTVLSQTEQIQLKDTVLQLSDKRRQ